MKFSIAAFPAELAKGQRFRLQRSPKVKGFILGLEISADNFQTNIGTSIDNILSGLDTKIDGLQ